MIPRFEWIEASSVAAALEALAGGAMVKAGGVDVIDRLKEGLDAPARLVNIRNVTELDRLEEDATGLRIGPLVTLGRLEDDAKVRGRYAAIADACGRAATPNIRNAATVGGNLLQRPRCWYFRNEAFPCLKKGGDACFARAGENDYHAIFGNDVCAIVHPSSAATALVAFGASITLAGRHGTREVPLESFFTRPDDDVRRENALRPDELLTAIRVPAPATGARSAYGKIGETASHDWPIAEVAAVLEMRGNVAAKASIVLGAAAPIPWRAKAAEAAIAGRAVTPETAQAAARAAVEGATPLERNGYKIPIFRAAVARAILAAAGEGRA